MDEDATADDGLSSEPITRVNRSKRDVIAWYDRLSPWYDALVARFDRRPRNQGIDLLNIDPGERVLEVGFGTGQALVSFADDVGSTGHVVGLDSYSGMCDVAYERVTELGFEDRVAIVRGDAEWLPLDGDAFDAVFASFTLELFDTPALPTVLGEWRRMLRDDGRLGVVALSKRDAGPANRAYERLHEAFPRYADCRPIFVGELLEEASFAVLEAETRSLWRLTVEIAIAMPRRRDERNRLA